MGFSQLASDVALGATASSDIAATQPATRQATMDADAIAVARRDMLKAADEHVASLRRLLDQIPADQQPQSQTSQRLHQAVAEVTAIHTASDAEIAARLVSQRAVAARELKPSEIKATSADRSPPATRPAIRGLDALLVFPGSSSQGQISSRVRPPLGCELLTLHGSDGTKIVGLFGRSTMPRAAGARPALLYFYGNGTCMAESLDVFNRFRSLGFDVIMADYQGYGMSDAAPSESGCYATADAEYDYLLQQNDVDHGRIVATGWSLGAAVAIDLASRRRVAGLATFSAFTSISDVGATMTKGAPLAMLLLGSRFDNLAKMGSISCPIFMAHGSNDPLVPPEMLNRLSAAAKTKVTVFHVDGAEHNDVFRRGGDSLYNRVRVFVNGLPAVSPTTMP